MLGQLEVETAELSTNGTSQNFASSNFKIKNILRELRHYSALMLNGRLNMVIRVDIGRLDHNAMGGLVINYS